MQVAAERVRDRALAFRLFRHFGELRFLDALQPFRDDLQLRRRQLDAGVALSADTVAVTCVLAIEPPLRPTVALSAIAKHAACAAATSSSGLVCPAGSPIRDGNVTGSVNAPLPAFACPLPSMIEPVQSTVTLRENTAIIDYLSSGPAKAGHYEDLICYFFPLAVTLNCTITPTSPSTSQATITQRWPGAGFIG